MLVCLLIARKFWRNVGSYVRRRLLTVIQHVQSPSYIHYITLYVCQHWPTFFSLVAPASMFLVFPSSSIKFVSTQSSKVRRLQSPVRATTGETGGRPSNKLCFLFSSCLPPPDVCQQQPRPRQSQNWNGRGRIELLHVLTSGSSAVDAGRCNSLCVVWDCATVHTEKLQRGKQTTVAFLWKSQPSIHFSNIWYSYTFNYATFLHLVFQCFLSALKAVCPEIIRSSQEESNCWSPL